ncbi:MAG TPA: gamma-glutamyltransferase family protein [bacterium]|nr:gamma-glutamyltransferase family protein [bacterium]
MAYAGGASEFGVRPVALGRRGMVASANPLATQAGVRMFAAGGNAVDAVVATAVAVTVAEPYFSGLGGIGIAVVTHPSGETRILNFLGRSPHSARPEIFTTETQDLGPMAPMVPGNVAGWARLHGEFGRLPLAQVLEPAIELADGGIPTTVFDYERNLQAVDRLTPHPEAARTYLHSGRPYQVGEALRQPGLAETLRTIAQDGWMALYEGRIARTIADWMAEHGGLIAEEDLRSYPGTLKWEAPVTATYRGYELRTCPPPSSAVQVLQTLRILEAFDLSAMEHLGVDYLALLAETIRLARMDAASNVADPNFVDVPLAWMLSDERVGELRTEVTRRVDAWRKRGRAGRASRNGARRRPAGRIRRARPTPDRSTTHLAAADEDGLAVNITQTLGSSYGSGVVIGRTGIAMNNGHHWCTLIPGDRKEIAPGKRRESPTSPVHAFGVQEAPVAPTHSFGIDPLGPAHAARGGRLAFMIGTPGSYGIPQTTAQMIINLIDFGRNIQDAIAAPRFRWKDDVGDPLPPKVLLLEGRFSSAVQKALAARGYRLEILEDWSMKVGGGQGIAFREDRWLAGGADPRRNGYAMGW